LIGVAPLAVAFTNNSVGTIDSVVWEFGDGNESVLTSPVHTYEDPGAYSVELTIYGVVNSDSLVRAEYIAVYDERPLISAIEDVPNDQGGQVLLSWAPSGWDGPVGATITQYSLWEEYIDQWVNINTAMATQADSYLFLANTFGDSSASGTNWAKFKIIAHTADPAVFFESPVDSGYSLDNIAPEAPGTLLATTGDDGVVLEWGTSNEANFMYYEVLKNDEVIAQLTDNNYTDATASFPMPAYYKVQSVDDAGNISPPTNEILTNMTDLEWFVNVRAELQTGENDYYNFLGVAEDATNGFDESYDIYEPPVPPGNYISVSFFIEDTNATQNSFAQLVSPVVDLSDTMQVWDMYIIVSLSDTTSLSFSLEAISDFPIILEDVATSQKYEIEENSTYEFYAIADSQYHFLISIGDTTAPTVALGASCSGPAILNSGEIHEFEWMINDGFMLDSVMVFISLDSGNTYDTFFTLPSLSSSFSWSVPDIPLNYGGMFKLKAEDYTGNVTEKESDYVFAIAGDTLSLDVSPGWTLFGLPSIPENDDITDNIEDNFDGYWWVYGFESGGYTFDSTFSAGKGYWLATMENATIDIIGEPIADPLDIELDAGWNLINDPFILNVSVDSLLITDLTDSSTYFFDEAVNSGLVNSLYSFDGNGYVEPDQLHAWDGFWLGVMNDNLKLTMPIHRHVNGNVGGRNNDENDWMITIEGQSGNAYDVTTVLGAKDNSTDQFDPAYDVVKAPLPPGSPYVSLYFLHEDWNLILGDRIAKDIRSPIQSGENKEWSLHVNSSSDNTILKWNIIDVPDDYEIGFNLDLSDYFLNIYDFDSLSVLNGTILTIRVGHNVLGINNGNVLPTEFALHQNYPNPFNPDTRIRYDLAKNEIVRITIYNLLGRKVKTLVNEHQEAGFKSIIWNATNDYGKPVSAGVYLYQIRAGEFVQTKKMVLLK
jgi:PKD repeat protein